MGNEVSPSTVSAVNRISATRALKNARHLQKVAPDIMPKVEPPEGFGSIIPHELLAQLHRLDRRADIGVDAPFAKRLKDVEVPSVDNMSIDPLFNGTLYFVRMEFAIQDQNNTIISVSEADVAAAVQYATAAVHPISAYAGQYGSNSVSVHQGGPPHKR